MKDEKIAEIIRRIIEHSNPSTELTNFIYDELLDYQKELMEETLRAVLPKIVYKETSKFSDRNLKHSDGWNGCRQKMKDKAKEKYNIVL